MIIGVDAGCLSVTDTNLKAGVYYVSLNLLRELSRLDNTNTYILYSFRPIPKDVMKQFSPKWKNRVIPSKGWLSLSLPLAFAQRKPDVFLALSQAMPWYHPFKTIGFIHGLDFLPKFHGERNKKLKQRSKYMIIHADKIITTSEFLQHSLFSEYHTTHVSVVPLGVNPIFFSEKEKHTEETPYFLFVGTLKPSKNIPTILQAFASFLKKTKKEYALLLIGSDFWLDEQVMETIKNVDIQKHIKVIPAVDNDVLVAYYKGATAFVSPSMYEGFGMTFVEAMAAACPVIGSTAGAIPEIVGDAGILIDPLDIEALANAMERVAAYTSLRLKLQESGKKRAKQYSWENFAKGVLEVINTV